MKISVTIVPRSSKNELSKLEDGSYRARVTSPPVDGKANEALVKLVSDFFGIPKSCVLIVRGLKSKTKTLEILK